MPFIVVWTADIAQADDTSPTIRVNSRRIGLWLEQVAYAEERQISSGEIYVFATMRNDTSVYLFEVRLDALRDIAVAGKQDAAPPPPATPPAAAPQALRARCPEPKFRSGSAASPGGARPGTLVLPDTPRTP